MMFETEKYAGRGYAPGNYCCICRTCNGQFIGDKRSWCCLGCAKSADRIEQLEAALRDIADGMGEKSLTEIGRYAPVIARKALGPDTGET